jgi:putative SOS response-associated peptidase YedK
VCNLYSMTKSQAAIREIARAMRDEAGNLPPLPGIFPDYMAPIVRNAPDGVRELVMARWGMPGPPQFGGAPITNIWLLPGRVNPEQQLFRDLAYQ